MFPKAPQLPGLSRRLWMSAAVLGGHWVVIVGAATASVRSVSSRSSVGPRSTARGRSSLGSRRPPDLSVVHRFAFRLLAPLAIIALAISTTLFVRLSEVWPISVATAFRSREPRSSSDEPCSLSIRRRGGPSVRCTRASLSRAGSRRTD